MLTTIVMSQEKFKPHPFAIKQGYLTKSPPLHKKKLAGWKKRWCILEPYGPNDEMCLSYYSDEDKSFFKMPKDRIFLAQCFKVEVDLRHSSHGNIFAIHLPARVYYFSASSRYEMTEWADTLCNHLNLISDISYPVEPRQKSWTLPSRSNPRIKLLPKSSSEEMWYIPPQLQYSFSPPSICRDPPSICRDPPSICRDPPSIGRDSPPIGRDPPPNGRDPSSNGRDPPPICHDPPPIGRDPPSNGRDPPPPIGRDPPPISCDPPPNGRDPPSNGHDPLSVGRDSHPSSPPPLPPPRRGSNGKRHQPLPPPPPPHKHPSPSPSPPESPSRETTFSPLLPPPPPPRKESTAST